MRSVDAAERALWRCEVCDTTGPWGPGWSHYSSIRIYENCGHLVVTCSEACRNSDRAAALILAYERNHSSRGGCKVGAA